MTKYGSAARVKLSLIFSVSLLLLISFAATNIISYYVSKASVRRNIIRNTLPVTSSNIYTEIQKDLMRPIFVSSLMANDTFLKEWALEGEEDVSRITRYLSEIKEEYGFFTSFFVSDLSKNYYSFNGVHKKISRDNAHDVWYYDFIDLDVPYDLDVDTDEVSGGTLTIFINHRLTDFDGNFIGVTGVGLNMGLVGELLETYQTTYRSNVYLVDPNGVIQVHPEAETIEQRDIHDVEGLGAIADEILSVGETARLFEYDSHGRHILLEVRYVPEFNWYLLVEQDEDTLLAELRSNLVRNLIIGFIVTLLVITINIITVNYFQKKIEVMATTDELTGAANRREFDIRMEQAVSLSGRQELALSLCIFDIDRFKQINDRMGHLSGDVVIKGIAEISMAQIRSSDLLARWGGDEFVILVHGDGNDARAVMERIRRAAARRDFFGTGSSGTEVTISAGIAVHRPGENPASLLSRADGALYRAKEAGRNRIETDESAV